MQEPRGFAGLASLASSLEEEDRSPTQEETEAEERFPVTEAEQVQAVAGTPTQSIEEDRGVASGRVNASRSRSSFPKWPWLVLIGLAALYVFDTAQKSNRKSGSSSTNTPQIDPGAQVSAPARKPQLSDLEFAEPPVGRDNALNVAQIRWCLREKIRIETLRLMLATNPQIAEFNRLVSGYNNRCGSYRYRQGALARARREVERHRSEIVGSISPERFGKRDKPGTKAAVGTSGRDRIATAIEPAPAAEAARKPENARTTEGNDQTPSRRADPTSEPSRPTPESPGQSDAVYAPEPIEEPPTDRHDLTEEIQRDLKALGYEPGPIDGIYGRKTKRAIQAFERDMGVTPKGDATVQLWQRLRREIAARER